MNTDRQLGQICGNTQFGNQPFLLQLFQRWKQMGVGNSGGEILVATVGNIQMVLVIDLYTASTGRVYGESVVFR